jgi:hypothetical protein
MTRLSRRLLAVFSLFFAFTLLSMNYSVCLADGTISGTITATYPNDPGFEGLWKYTVNVAWESDESQGGALSHTSVFLGLEACECICDEGIVAFPSPAGTSTGDPECTESYNGEYACLGDPAIPDGIDSPAVKFEHDEEPSCQPGFSGSGIFCFYSPLPPAPYNVNLGGLGLKTGNGEYLGEVSGNSPTCQCETPVVVSTWGQIKRLIR